MDIFKRFMLFDKTVVISVIDAHDLVTEAVRIHGLSRTATAALGRTLVATAFMCEQLKNKEDTLSVTINGGGSLGRVVTAGGYGCKVRGYVENPALELPLNAKGKLDVGGAVGRDGYISVIKDIGLKEPYAGRCPLVDGEIADDFAFYFTSSEQQPSAVALGVLSSDGGCVSAGGVFAQILPGCKDETITVVEDVMSNFTNVSALMRDEKADGIIEKYFSHFDIFPLPDIVPEYRCNCYEKKIEQVVMSLGRDEAYDILQKEGKVELTCQFCQKKYLFDKQRLDKLFSAT